MSRVKPIDIPSEVDSEGFMFSTCKITTDGSGGPLVDFDGNIVWKNDTHDQKITGCVQTNKIRGYLRDIWLWWFSYDRLGDSWRIDISIIVILL